MELNSTFYITIHIKRSKYLPVQHGFLGKITNGFLSLKTGGQANIWWGDSGLILFIRVYYESIQKVRTGLKIQASLVTLHVCFAHPTGMHYVQ